METRFLRVGITIVWVIYLFQLRSPLRLNTDGLSYLVIAASYSDGHGFLWHGRKSHFPSGYPAIVGTLERMGIGTSAGFIGWNYLMMGISTVTGMWLLEHWLHLPKRIALLVSLMYLLNWATIRYALIPGSEPTYIAIAFSCLGCLTAAETCVTKWRWPLCIAGLSLVPLAMTIRLVGVVLPCAAMWSFIAIISQGRVKSHRYMLTELVRAHRKLSIGVGIAIGLGICVLALGVSRTGLPHERWARRND